MTAKDYTLNCQVCESTYHPVIKLDGTPRKTKYLTCGRKCLQYISRIATGKRSDSPKRPTPSSEIVYKSCAFCGGEFGPMLTGQARKKTYCSIVCAGKAKSYTKLNNGKWVRLSRPCKQCFGPVLINRDDNLFCTHYCYEVYFRKISDEVKGLRRIVRNVRAKAKLVYQITIASEINALKRIKQKIDQNKAICDVCGKSHVRRYKFSRRCSISCDKVFRAQQKENEIANRKTDKAIARNRIYKSKRRALIRGTQTESIDPFDVFDRDKWRCYLCGVKTPKALRGTYNDNAPELEHKIPISLGGTHTWDNVACSCRKCNNEKGATIMGQLGLVL